MRLFLINIVERLSQRGRG